MRTHYDILEIECSANIDDIRKAYRKMALKWHPDKNRENADQAHKEFLLVQQAYEVLIDPVERRWYDENKDRMVDADYKDNQVNVVIYTSASCYSGFDDGPMGFYTVYSELFRNLSEEDMEFKSMDDPDAPLFGDSQSDYDEVVAPFYDYWCNYTTRKPYTWNDPCNIKQAQNAYERKKMKQLNRENQNKMKDARNKEIRFLAYFVKKRDKRVKAHNERLRQRADEIHRKAKEKTERDRKENRLLMEGYEEAGWVKLDEEQLKMIEDSESEEEDDQTLHCQSCDKSFRSLNTFNNHKKSKKHLATVMSLLKTLEEMGIDENALSDMEDLTANTQPVEDQPNEASQPSQSKKKKKKKKGKTVLNDHLNNYDPDEEEKGNSQTSKINGNDKSNVVKNVEPEPNIIDSVENPITESQAPTTEIDGNDPKINEDNAETLEDKIFSPPNTTNDSANPDTLPVTLEESSQLSKEHIKPNKTNKTTTSKEQFLCRVCNESFNTRNKLFQHINETKHARIEVAEQTKKKNKKKKN